MTITLDDWKKYAERQPGAANRTPVTNEQKASAERASQAMNHPGFALLQDALLKYKERFEGESRTAEHRLAHGRGVSIDEMHRLREDIACCSGWLKALTIALDTLPEVVKAGQE